MTDKVRNGMKSVESEREAILHDVEKFKKSYAEYIVADREKIRESIEHPYVVTKKDVRKKKFRNFFDKIKKAIGL
jgi:hypothetical protein